jgi:hypothetical protein
MTWTKSTTPTTNYLNDVVNDDVSQTYDTPFFEYNASNITYNGFYVSYVETWDNATKPSTSWA